MKNEPDSLHSIEEHLKSLKPQPLSPQQVKQWTANLPPLAPRRRPPLILTHPLLWASAACLFLTTALFTLPILRTPSTSTYQTTPVLLATPPSPPALSPRTPTAEAMSPPQFPTQVGFQIQGTENRGIVRVVDDIPLQQIRVRTVNAYQWENPVNKTRIQISIPRDEIFLVPATIY